MDFGVGDNVVMPGCGVGRIEAVEKKDFGGGARVELFRITLECEDARVWIPVDRIGEKRVRPVMDADRVDETIALISEQEAPKKRKNWNQRRRRYDEMLQSNSPKIMAKLLGELAAVREGKPLTFTEKKLFRQVWDLLEAEFAASLGVERDTVAARLEEVTTAEAAAA